MLKNKTVLVTGSTSGIGLSIAQAFAKRQANVIINGAFPSDDISTLLKEVSNLTSGTVIFEEADLTKSAEIESMFIKIAERFGGVDIVVNNAGMQYVSPVDQFPAEKWDYLIALNLSAVFHCTRLALPYMRQSNWGRIINIASAHGLVASINKAAYVAAKHGVIGLTKVTALETAKENITCNAICPGWVYTSLVENQIHEKAKLKNISFEEAMHELLSEKQPSLRFVKPEDIGEMALFLCQEAASQMTGAAWSVDGGWTAQ